MGSGEGVLMYYVRTVDWSVYWRCGGCMCVFRSREGGRASSRCRCVIVSIVTSAITSALRGRVVVDLLYDNSWLKCMTALWGLGDSGRKICACLGVLGTMGDFGWG